MATRKPTPRKQSSSLTRPATARAATTQASAVRFEATLGPTPRSKALLAAAELDLDRLPDADGKVKLLLSAEDAQRLLEQGYEVHLTAAIPVAPLNPKLVMSDEQAQSLLEQKLKGTAQKGGR